MTLEILEQYNDFVLTGQLYFVRIFMFSMALAFFVGSIYKNAYRKFYGYSKIKNNKIANKLGRLGLVIYLLGAVLLITITTKVAPFMGSEILIPTKEGVEQLQMEYPEFKTNEITVKVDDKEIIYTKWVDGIYRRELSNKQ